MSGDGCGRIARACADHAPGRLARDDGRRCDHARTRVLPRQLRVFTQRDGGRRSPWTDVERPVRQRDRATAIMTSTIYVPRDSSAVSLGADEVARAIAAQAARRGASIRLVRNGSYGLFWLEPMVEV